MEQPQKRFYNAENKRTAGTRGKTDTSQYKCFCKTLQNFLWSDCFQVQHFRTLHCQSAVSHAAQAFTGLDKTSLVCQGVRQKEWEGHFFFFYFKPSFAEARSSYWLPASSGTRLISQFREKFATQHSFLTLATPQHVCRCTLYLFHTRFLSVWMWHLPNFAGLTQWHLWRQLRFAHPWPSIFCKHSIPCMVTMTPHALWRVRWRKLWKLTTFWFRGLIKCSLPLWEWCWGWRYEGTVK